MRSRLLRGGGLLAVAVATALLAGAAPAAAAPGDASAYGATVDVKSLGAEVVKAGPFAQAKASGPTADTYRQVNVHGVLTTGVINTAASRNEQTGAVQSSASTADVRLPLVQQALGSVYVKVIEAKCSAVQKGVSGSSTLAEANLGRLGDIPVAPPPNTTRVVNVGATPVATVILNEQIHNQDGSLTVNGLHVKLLGGALNQLGSGDIVVSSATCGPAGPPIPLASGAGMWIAFGLLAAVALPAGVWALRNRRSTTDASA